MFNPLTLLIILLLTLAISAGTATVRRERSAQIALAGTLIVAAGLLAARVAAVHPVGSGFPWSWAIDENNWWPSAALLLLLLTALLAMVLRPDGSHHTLPALSLAAAALAAAWADSPASLVTMWTIVGLAAWVALRIAGKGRAAPPPGFWLAPLLFWLAAATFTSVPEAGTARPGTGPALSEGLWLLAAIVAIGGIPFHLFRHHGSAPGDQNTNTFMQIAPAAAGAVLLASLAGGAGASRYALPLTLTGLLGLLWSAYAAWRHHAQPAAVGTALLLGEASLLILLAAWADQAAVLAETRVMVLAAGAFLFAATDGEHSTWRRLALVPALAALAAFPLTAGFAGRGALYSAWLESGNWLPIVVVVLLQMPLLAAGMSLVWPRTWPPGRLTLGSLALLLPALGLISWQAVTLVVPLAWAAIALQIVGALLLFRYAAEAEDLEQALQQALAPTARVTPAADTLRRGSQSLGRAMRDAAAILEGGGGLLWVLFFLLLIWLAR
jgi:hypothetical protein